MKVRSVRDLIEQGSILVEDGNHGEYRPLPNEFISDGVKFIRAADMTSGIVDFGRAQSINDAAAGRIRKGVGASGDVILSHKGTVGRVVIVPADSPAFVCSPQTTIWRSLDCDAVDPRFLAYSLRSPQFQRGLQAIGSESDMAPYVSLGSQKTMSIPLPDADTQRKISEVLGTLDDKITVNRHLVSSVDDLIRVHVGGRLAESARLWDMLDINFGEAFKGDSFSAPETGRALVRIRDLKSQKCQVWTTERRANEIEVRPGDLLVGMDAEFRAARWSGPLGVLNQRVLAVSSAKYGSAIAREMLRDPLCRIERGKTGTTVIHLNKGDLLAEDLLVPVDADVPALRALVDPLWDRAVAAEQESVRLAATRDELLSLLMSGLITVKDAEKTVEEVV
ncbi:MAG: restriction endonuclease subunit S [Brachybacterium tyrofermentans]